MRSHRGGEIELHADSGTGKATLTRIVRIAHADSPRIVHPDCPDSPVKQQHVGQASGVTPKRRVSDAAIFMRNVSLPRIPLAVGRQLILLIGTYLLVCGPAAAQMPKELQLPETTRVLRLESHQTCQGCPAWFYELYADGSWNYEGLDAVFLLGEDGPYKLWETIRRVDRERDSKYVETMRDQARRNLSDYRRAVDRSSRPDSDASQISRAIRAAAFETWQRRYPHDLTETPSVAEPVQTIRIDLDGKSVSVRFLASAAPAELRELREKILTVSGVSRFGMNHPAPAFRSEPDAMLWFARTSPYFLKTYGVILYRTDKATIFGWNNVGLENRGFQVHSIQLEPGRVAGLVAAINAVERNPRSGHSYSNPDTHSILNSVFGGMGGNRLIQKDRVGVLTGNTRPAINELNSIVESMLPLLGPDDPERIKRPAVD